MEIDNEHMTAAVANLISHHCVFIIIIKLLLLLFLLDCCGSGGNIIDCNAAIPLSSPTVGSQCVYPEPLNICNTGLETDKRRSWWITGELTEQRLSGS